VRSWGTQWLRERIPGRDLFDLCKMQTESPYISMVAQLSTQSSTCLSITLQRQLSTREAAFFVVLPVGCQLAAGLIGNEDVRIEVLTITF